MTTRNGTREPLAAHGRLALAAAFSNLAVAATCCAADLTKENWTVPNWTTVITAPGAVREFIGKTWSGHCQGMCVSSNAIYFSFHDQIVKTDWFGRLLRWVPVDIHGGDICIWNDKVYTGVWRKPKASGEKWCAAIYVYDADSLKLLNVRMVPWDAGADGITALDGVIYLAMGARGKYDPETKSGRLCWYCKFNADTLEQIGEPFCVDHGDDSVCGSQNMATDGTYIYSSHYTDDEAAKRRNVVVHDKNDFKVVAKYRFGRNNGIDVVPGGKDGAVRFAWCFTPNWTNHRYKPLIPVQSVLQFVELKDGEVSDFTEYGGGYRTYIKR
ncbi:MAG: hypothetical protein IKF72_15780 [Kiritimatiellae bacterium]|nr:hypothetical protein [Kiritimatiellia bacterium]